MYLILEYLMSFVQIYESYKKLQKLQKIENPFTVLSPPMDWGDLIMIRLFSLYIDLVIKVRLGELVGYTFVKNSVKNLKVTKDGLENWFSFIKLSKDFPVHIFMLALMFVTSKKIEASTVTSTKRGLKCLEIQSFLVEWRN